jgi:hypothetical protein
VVIVLIGYPVLIWVALLVMRAVFRLDDPDVDRGIGPLAKSACGCRAPCAGNQAG